MYTQNSIEIKFLKTHPDAKLPQKKHSDPKIGDTGYDLFTVEEVVVPPRGTAIAPVGLKLAYITPGYWFRIEPRSGLGFVKNIQPHLGIIDNPYRGDLGVKLYNFGDDTVVIKKGIAAGQFCIYELLSAEISWSDTIVETDRGEKGFGHSGI